MTANRQHHPATTPTARTGPRECPSTVERYYQTVQANADRLREIADLPGTTPGSRRLALSQAREIDAYLTRQGYTPGATVRMRTTPEQRDRAAAALAARHAEHERNRPHA